MNDITAKQITLRKASAMGLVFCQPETAELIRANQVAKGNVFEFARAAGFLGAKYTQHLLPHCHPVGIEAMDIQFDLLAPGLFQDLLEEAAWNRSGILIRATASSVGRTGIEMEVLTGVSIAALEIYDFLKPHDKNLEISGIKLLSKTGGKSDRRMAVSDNPECAVLVCSDSLAAGTDTRTGDLSGKLIQEILHGHKASPAYYSLVADNKEQIQHQLRSWIEAGVPYIFTCGGTGIDPRDVTVEAVRELLDAEAPGVGEAIRAFGRTRVPTAILSAAIAGRAGKSFIVTLPGSPSGVRESLAAILPAIFHAGIMIQSKGHK